LPSTPTKTRSGRTSFFAAITWSKSRGVGLHVRGDDPKWVRGTYNELASEIRKALPKWRFLRSGHLWWLYAAVGTGTAVYGLYPLLHAHRVWWGLASALAGAVLGGLVLAAARTLLPGFEIVPAGGSSKAGRVLGVVGALASNVLLGVLVNVMTK
jgi:hypothetical protein